MGERTTEGAPSNNGEACPVIPDYQVLRRIGAGSYGEVWLGRNVAGRWVAIKVCHRQPGQGQQAIDREFRGIQRYEPVSHSHPSLMPILHIGRNESGGYFYYIMELADPLEPVDQNPGGVSATTSQSSSSGNEICPDGYVPRTLKSLLSRRNRLSIEECVGIGLALTTALERLHQAGLVHRDIKPSNIIFVGGIPKLADIGLVTQSDATQSHVGTQGFYPLEGPGTPQADLYSLGKVLYEASTGKDRQQFPEPATRLGDGVGDPEDAAEFNEILLKACAENSRHRYRDSASMNADLRLLGEGGSVRRLRAANRRFARLRRVSILAGMIALLATVGVIFQRHQAARFRQLAEESLSHLVQLHLSAGLARVEEGEAMGALPWLVEVLRLERKDSERSAIHSRRIELILRQSPKPAGLGAHDGPIWAAHWSSDGTRVVTASADGSARIWDAASGQLLTPPLAHGDEVNWAQFSPDGNLVVTASDDGTARLWDAHSGSGKFEAWNHGNPVFEAAFSPDGRQCLTASRDGTVRVWSTEDGNPIGSIIVHPGGIRCMAWDPVRQRIATGGRDHQIWVWETATGTQSAPPMAHESDIRDLAFSVDGRWLASGSSDETARIWDAATGEPMTRPLRHSGTVWRVTFSPDGRFLASSGGSFQRSGEARVWEVPTGDPLPTVLQHDKPVHSVNFSPDARWIATASIDGKVRVWKSANGDPVGPPLANSLSAWGVEFSPEGRRLLVCGRDVLWRVWDLATDQTAQARMVHPHYLHNAQFSPDDRLIATAAYDGTVGLWQAATGRAMAPMIQMPKAADHASFNPAGSRLGVLADGRLQIFPTRSLTNQPVAEANLVGCRFLAWSPDGHRVATVDDQAGAIVYRTDAGWREEWRFPGLEMTRHVGFSPDGRWLVIGGGNHHVARSGEARVWDVTSGKPVTPGLAHPGVVLTSSFSPDGRRLVTACSDPTSEPRGAQIWDLESGKPIGPPLMHQDGVTTVLYGPDGTRIATGGEDGVARIWDAGTGKPLGPPMMHKRGVDSVQFSPDGRLLLTASRDRTARLWDVASGDPVGPPLSHDGWVVAAAFNKNATKVLTASEDHSAALWDVSYGHFEWYELDEFSRLLTGRLLKSTAKVESMLPSEVLSLWQSLRRSRPEQFSLTADQVRNWHAFHAMRAEQMRHWYGAVFQLETLLANDPDHQDIQFRLDRARVELARERNALTELDPELIDRFYPRRPRDLPSRCLDLSPFYNAPALWNWHRDVPDDDPLVIPLGESPNSPPPTKFDVCGVIQLDHRPRNGRDAYDFPAKSTGIPVGQTAAKIHLLHGLQYGFCMDEPTALYRIHYTDGESLDIPFIPCPSQEATTLMQSTRIDSPQHDSRMRRSDRRIYASAISNPRPTIHISSLDVMALNSEHCLFAITLE